MKEVQGCHDGEKDEPPPEKDKDLLVDDVDGQDALGVVPLDLPAWAVLVKRALRHPEKQSHISYSRSMLAMKQK